MRVDPFFKSFELFDFKPKFRQIELQISFTQHPQHDFLTMTKLYNVRDRLKALERGDGAPLDESEKAIHDAGCVSILHDLHNRIDDAVADAYGWPRDLADADILARLVALNRERADEERRGLVRWLRPEYQAARGAAATQPIEEQEEADLALPQVAAQAPALPEDEGAFYAALQSTLRALARPAEPIEIARRFRNGGRASRRIERGLLTLAAVGNVRKTDTGWFVPRER